MSELLFPADFHKGTTVVLILLKRGLLLFAVQCPKNRGEGEKVAHPTAPTKNEAVCQPSLFRISSIRICLGPRPDRGS